jgi:DNA-directed RNA polymerase subunit H
VAELDIRSHILVPEHILLSEEERDSVLEKFQIMIDNLPKILITDPAICNIGTEENPLKPGDVVKIIRKSPTAGSAVAYRVVVQR